MTKSENRKSGSREIPIKEVDEFSVGDDKLLHQRIAEKAYELYECPGLLPWSRCGGLAGGGAPGIGRDRAAN